MELDELGIDIEAQNCLDQIQQESRTSADYDRISPLQRKVLTH